MRDPSGDVALEDFGSGLAVCFGVGFGIFLGAGSGVSVSETTTFFSSRLALLRDSLAEMSPDFEEGLDVPFAASRLLDFTFESVLET